MSSRFNKIGSGSHWTRPKPKIYECNYSAHERAYQDPYRDYSSTKQYIKENAREWAEKESAIRQELDDIQKYGTRRAGSMTPRRFMTSESPLAVKRANSTIATQEANAEGSYLRSRLEVNKEKNYLSDSSSKNTEDSLGVRASSLPKATTSFDVSQDEEMANIERRLQKLRKLREELGLPSEAGSDPVPEPISARGREIKANMSSASSRTNSKTRIGDSSEDYSSSRLSSRSNGISSSSSSRISGRSSITKDDTEEYKPTRRSARASAAAAASTTSMSNGRSSLSRDDLDSKYSCEPSPRSTRRRVVDDFDSKSSFKSSNSKASSSSSKIISSDVDNYDDDMLLPDIRKKLPTSQEILDRIKGMDL